MSIQSGFHHISELYKYRRSPLIYTGKITSIHHLENTMKIVYYLTSLLCMAADAAIIKEREYSSTTSATSSVSTVDSTSTSQVSAATIPTAIVLAAQEVHEETVGNGELCYWNSTEMYESMLAFFNTFMYPNNAAVAATINSTLLAEDVKGLIDVTRKFDGRELNTEYLFGLFSQLDSDENAAFNLVGYPVDFEIVQFVADCNLAHTSAIINFTYPFLDNLTIPIQIDTRNFINENRQVSSYEAIFVRFEWFYEITNSLAIKKLNKISKKTGVDLHLSGKDKLKLKTVKSICEVAENYCVGDNKQYANTTVCQDHLFNHTRFGASYEGGFDTVFCRSLHQNMIKYRPDVHCPHIGPTGGMFCTDDDKNYYDVVLDWGNGYLTDMVKV